LTDHVFACIFSDRSQTVAQTGRCEWIMGFSGKCSSLGQLDKDLSKCPKTPRAGSDTAYDAIKGAAGWFFSRILVAGAYRGRLA